MLDAWQVDSMLERLEQDRGKAIDVAAGVDTAVDLLRRVVDGGRSNVYKLAKPTSGYRDMIGKLADDLLDSGRAGVVRDRFRLFGILFARPGHALFESQIKKNINYLHHLTGELMTVFCPGFGVDWPPGSIPCDPPYEDADVVDKDAVEGQAHYGWMYSDKAYLRFVDELQKRCRWRSRDTTTMLLSAVDYRRSSTPVNWGNCIDIDLESAVKAGAAASVHSFMTDFVSRMKQLGPSLDAISDSAAVEKVMESVADDLLAKIPIAGKAFKKTAFYKTVDYSM